jgi:hypothetical protein
MSPEQESWCTELWKDLFYIRDFAVSVEERESKMRDAHAYYKLITSHQPEWKYPQFREALNRAFQGDWERMEMMRLGDFRDIAYSPTDMRDFMKGVLGIDVTGLFDEWFWGES